MTITFRGRLRKMIEYENLKFEVEEEEELLEEFEYFEELMSELETK